MKHFMSVEGCGRVDDLVAIGAHGTEAGLERGNIRIHFRGGRMIPFCQHFASSQQLRLVSRIFAFAVEVNFCNIRLFLFMESINVHLQILHTFEASQTQIALHYFLLSVGVFDMKGEALFTVEFAVAGGALEPSVHMAVLNVFVESGQVGEALLTVHAVVLDVVHLPVDHEVSLTSELLRTLVAIKDLLHFAPVRVQILLGPGYEVTLLALDAGTRMSVEEMLSQHLSRLELFGAVLATHWVHWRLQSEGQTH